ncbi:phosphotransferase family protein [Latilactobacillus fragifolii]|uniref:phosphotransferase family protein n=1 Tax=Latilactobacillus fragifolii TaxID=2814244 RepID=UPI001ABA669C|nr:phosphotransferase family protein [Latilactobacillus fragifolii]
MNFDLDTGWQVRPAGGDTGAAFLGVRASEKIFLKRNTSPFLAALSAEGITPRLIWTKRISSGDVLTAQEWLNGRTLKRDEMNSPQVAKLLARVHQSQLLKRMLQKVGGRVWSANEMLQAYFYDLPQDLRQHPFLEQTADYLKQTLRQLQAPSAEVCHGDLSHKNWLLSDINRLYLVDWDSAMLADPAVDFGMILFQYVPRQEWYEWLENYGLEVTPELMMRVNWYGSLNLLQSIKHHYQRGRFTEMNRDILRLEEVISEIINKD